ncbi:MAG: hypothetical protein HQK95_07735 [Nitrospirae bacterium]|nr:hypothetical protein [Nitrospirota bacterium]
MVAYVAEDTDLVFDPAAGRGAFFEALLKIDKQGVLYLGTDVDKDVLTDEIYNNKSCFVEERDFIKNPPLRKFKAIVANPPYIIPFLNHTYNNIFYLTPQQKIVITLLVLSSFRLVRNRIWLEDVLRQIPDKPE